MDFHLSFFWSHHHAHQSGCKKGFIMIYNIVMAFPSHMGKKGNIFIFVIEKESWTMWKGNSYESWGTNLSWVLTNPYNKDWEGSLYNGFFLLLLFKQPSQVHGNLDACNFLDFQAYTEPIFPLKYYLWIAYYMREI